MMTSTYQTSQSHNPENDIKKLQDVILKPILTAQDMKTSGFYTDGDEHSESIQKGVSDQANTSHLLNVRPLL
jgi:hypothetical protein